MTSLSQVSDQELIQELKNRIKNYQTPKETSKITGLEIQKEKLIAQLDDGREVIFPISLLTKLEILSPEIKPEQLKKYELWGDGQAIFFPEIDEVLPTWIISQGLSSC
ncbi:hypothetical protein GvMRE_Ic5g31 [endosymbiont GvMRE of Glomus versiforme]|nr:hypothetical protein GvMRE_Ic5g31 [endosymbiont GvMRE of Glomus versiforme]